MKSLLSSRPERAPPNSVGRKTEGERTEHVDTTSSAVLRGNACSEDIQPLNSSTKVHTRIYQFEDIARLCQKEGRPEDQNPTPYCAPVLRGRGHGGMVTSLSFSPTASFVASGCDKGVVNIWSLQVRVGAVRVSYDLTKVETPAIVSSTAFYYPHQHTVDTPVFHFTAWRVAAPWICIRIQVAAGK